MEDTKQTKAVPWHSVPLEQVASQLESNTYSGLTAQEAHARLTRFGRNVIAEEEKEPFWKEFLEELREPMVLMLLVTGIFYAIWGELSTPSRFL